MGPSIRIFKNVDELSLFFTKKLASLVKETPGGSYFSMALSGGSTPRKVFDYMAVNSGNRIEWEKIKVFWGDERCVPPGSGDSNYRMAKESILDHVPIPADNIFRIMGESSPSVEAARYSEIVKKHVPSFQSMPQFDLIMLGLGDDGHTASIFPGNLQLFSSDKLFEVAEHPQTKQKRITATGSMINQARSIFFLVTGESKAEMAARIINRKKGWENFPASMVHTVKGELTWLLDNRAAVLLHY